MPNSVALSFCDICALQYKELVYGSFQKQEYFLLFLCIFDLPPSTGLVPLKYSLIFFSCRMCVFLVFPQDWSKPQKADLEKKL